METLLKQQIVEETKNYMTSKVMSQANFARYCGVNPSYLSNILNGKFMYNTGEKDVAISDGYFEAIARAIGMSLAVAYWRTVHTPQFIEMIATLEDAKKRGAAKMILGQTGCGKTFSTNRFVEANPINTYRITVSNQHKIQDVTNDLGSVLGVRMDNQRARAQRMRAISDKLRDLRMQGGRPVVIIDEAENMTNGMIGLCKGIYDAINEYCGLVLIGTDELDLKLLHLAKYPGSYGGGIPQFRRRFKAGTVRLAAINKEDHFAEFLADIDPDLCRILRGLCDNYGELHDFLEPALRSAAGDGVALTDKYFRTMYKIA